MEGSAGGAGEQRQLPQGPSGTKPVGTKPAPSPHSSCPACQGAPSLATSQSPGSGLALAIPAGCTRPTATHSFIAGAKTCVAWRVPHPKHHTLLPTGQILCMSPETPTFVGALPEQPANAKGSAGCIRTQGQGAAPRCCTSLPAFHCPIPPSPTHISFVPLFLIPTFVCCPLRHPLRYPTACPSTLFSKFTSQPPFLWDWLQSQEQESKRENTSLGPSPFHSPWYWYSACRRQDHTKGGTAFMCALAPSLGPSTLSQQ